MHFLWNQFTEYKMLHKYWENNFKDFTGTGVISAWQLVPQHSSLYPFPFDNHWAHHIRNTYAPRNNGRLLHLPNIPALLDWSLNSLDSLLGCCSICLALISVDRQAHLKPSSIFSLGEYQLHLLSKYSNAFYLDFLYLSSAKSSLNC